MKTYEVVVRMYYSADRPDRNYDVVRFSFFIEVAKAEEIEQKAEDRFVLSNGIIDFEIERVNYVNG